MNRITDREIAIIAENLQEEWESNWSVEQLEFYSGTAIEREWFEDKCYELGLNERDQNRVLKYLGF